MSERMSTRHRGERAAPPEPPPKAAPKEPSVKAEGGAAPSKDGGGNSGVLKEKAEKSEPPKPKRMKIEDNPNRMPAAPATVIPQPLLPIKLVAGSTGAPGFRDGACAAATFRGPSGIALAPDGSLIVADSDNRRLRKIVPAPKPEPAADGDTTATRSTTKPDEDAK